jgi:hypothetical protein
LQVASESGFVSPLTLAGVGSAVLIACGVCLFALAVRQRRARTRRAQRTKDTPIGEAGAARTHGLRSSSQTGSRRAVRRTTSSSLRVATPTVATPTPTVGTSYGTNVSYVAVGPSSMGRPSESELTASQRTHAYAGPGTTDTAPVARVHAYGGVQRAPGTASGGVPRYVPATQLSRAPTYQLGDLDTGAVL